MTREAYINELRSYLGRLPLNERGAGTMKPPVRSWAPPRRRLQKLLQITRNSWGRLRPKAPEVLRLPRWGAWRALFWC